jgi:hypothetical protein
VGEVLGPLDEEIEDDGGKATKSSNQGSTAHLDFSLLPVEHDSPRRVLLNLKQCLHRYGSVPYLDPDATAEGVGNGN